MPEAISTKNLVTLPITSQELGGGGAFLLPPSKIGLSNNLTTIGLKSHCHPGALTGIFESQII